MVGCANLRPEGATEFYSVFQISAGLTARRLVCVSDTQGVASLALG